MGKEGFRVFLGLTLTLQPIVPEDQTSGSFWVGVLTAITPVLWLFPKEHAGRVVMAEQASPILCTLKSLQNDAGPGPGATERNSLLLVSDHAGGSKDA